MEDEREKEPITDKVNFPPEIEQKIAPRLVVGVEQLAYADGKIDGYRKAVFDFVLLFCVAYLLMTLTSFGHE